MPTKTLYQILQVDPQASPEVIEAAYHRLARIYHPDVNSSADSVRIMQELNDAYGILRDPQKRQEYDRSLKAQNKIPPPNTTQARPTYTTSQTSNTQPKPGTGAKYSTPDFPVSCQKCGKSDSSLRLCFFPFVISILILTFRRSWGGIYCQSCRRVEMFKAKLLTSLLGWWGIPFGPIYSLGVIYSASEGKIPEEANASYLAALSGYFINRREMAYAQEAMEMSLGYKFDHELSKIYYDLFRSGQHIFNKPESGSTSGFLIGSGIIIGFVSLLCVVSGFFSSSQLPEYSTIPVRPTPTASCKNWYSISSSDLGKHLCVWGTVTEVDSNAFYKTIIRFSQSPRDLIFVDTKYTYPDVSPGTCVAAKGEIIQLENSRALDINGKLYECP